MSPTPTARAALRSLLRVAHKARHTPDVLVPLLNRAPRIWNPEAGAVLNGDVGGGFLQLSNEKRAPGWLGYIGDYTTQLYRDYNKPTPVVHLIVQ